MPYDALVENEIAVPRALVCRNDGFRRREETAGDAVQSSESIGEGWAPSAPSCSAMAAGSSSG